jgi:hypothetical protein
MTDNGITFATPMSRQQPQNNSWTDGWFKIRKLNLDSEMLRKTCLGVQSVIKERYQKDKVPGSYDNSTTNLFSKYNIFMFSSAPLHGLYSEICRLWHDVKMDDDIYYLQSWLNVYDETPSIGWHYHWTEKYGAWHGFYCVDVDVSKTTYALQPRHYQQSKQHEYISNGQSILEYNDTYELIDVVGTNNTLIMSPSAGDSHRNIPWNVQGRPRITIAFDIVPGRHIHNEDWENHWIPLL